MQRVQPKIKLILIGLFEKELDPLPAKTLFEIENNSAIFHINWSDHVEYYMTLADLFVFPSHREGFPNVLLQAGAMHLPIICSYIPGNIDIVVNYKTGYTFEKLNEEDLMKVLCHAISNPIESKRLADNLNDIILRCYKSELIWEALLNEYNKLTDELQ